MTSPGSLTSSILPGPIPDAQNNSLISAVAASLSSLYVPLLGAASYTYNADGTVATETVGGITTTYAYNVDGTVHTATRSGVTLTYSYDSNGNVTGSA